MPSKKILLVFPSRREMQRTKYPIPLSVITLVAPLRAAGYDVEIFDQRAEPDAKVLDPEYLKSLLFVGFSVLTGSPIRYGLKLARRIRKLVPDLPLVWGGVHPSLLPDQTIGTCSLVDIICRGEGEETIVDLARALHDQTELGDVQGLTFRHNGQITHTPDRPYIDMDDMLPLAYDILDPDHYRIKEQFLYQTNRGCPFQCSFCDVIGFNKKSVREKSVDRILHELKEIDTKFKPDFVDIVDDLFFINIHKCREIMKGMIELKLGFQWGANCRANIAARFDDDDMRLIKESGCTKVFIGAESASVKLLKGMHKAITPEQITTAVENFHRYGIQTTLNFICGFPDEEYADVQESIAYVKSIMQRLGDLVKFGGINLYAPYPGSELYDKAIQEGHTPPKTFAAWGGFVLNEKTVLPWMTKSYIEKVWRVAVVSRWAEPSITLQDLSIALRQNRFERFVAFVIAKIFWKRWQKQWFSFPIDIHIWNWSLKNIAKVG